MSIPVDRNEVQRLVAEEAAQVVEVLPPAEYEDEHIDGAISVPLNEVDERAPLALDPSTSARRPLAVMPRH
jgi:rhodanese-related sulfurtransferase